VKLRYHAESLNLKLGLATMLFLFLSQTAMSVCVHYSRPGDACNNLHPPSVPCPVWHWTGSTPVHASLSFVPKVTELTASKTGDTGRSRVGLLFLRSNATCLTGTCRDNLSQKYLNGWASIPCDKSTVQFYKFSTLYTSLMSSSVQVYKHSALYNP
jgi:hypothetical protein